MNKGETVTKTYFAVKMKNGEYANDYWGYSSDFTENETRDALVKNLDEAQYMLEEENADKIQLVKVTYEVVAEWE